MEENLTNKNKIAALEALLFIHGESLSFSKIEKTLDFKIGEGREVVVELQNELKADNRGLSLVYDDDKVQLVTKPDFGAIISSFAKEELTDELSPASLEALSLIAYLGPISRTKLEYFRGVNSVFTLRNLMVRGLVERFPDPKRLNSYLYRPSLELIKHLGVQGVQDLPDYEKFKLILSNFNSGLTDENKHEG